MGIVYRVLWVLKSLWIILSETISILRKLQQKKLTFLGCPRKFYHRFMYIAPSSGEPLPNLILALNGFFGGLRLFSDVWEWECMLQSLNDWWKFIQIHQYYTMALNCDVNCRSLNSQLYDLSHRCAYCTVSWGVIVEYKICEKQTLDMSTMANWIKMRNSVYAICNYANKNATWQQWANYE